MKQETLVVLRRFWFLLHKKHYEKSQDYKVLLGS